MNSNMLWWVCSIIIILICLDVGRSSYVYFRFGDITKKTIPLSQEGSFDKTLLVLGDSTAVGVGATSPQESVAGLMAHEGKYTFVENLAVSGARARDLASQWEKRILPRYDTILVHIGANDVIQFGSRARALKELESTLSVLPHHADEVVWTMAGNIGGAAFFPYIVRPWYQYQSIMFNREFAKYAHEVGITYVDFYTSPKEDPFVKRPHMYLSPDLLHPSSAGYQLWFSAIQRVRHGKE